MAEWPYVYFWNRCGRKGQPCRVTARGKMNSCRVEFADGFVMITSRNAIRKLSSGAALIEAHKDEFLEQKGALEKSKRSKPTGTTL